MACTETLPRRYVAEHPFCCQCGTHEVDEAAKPLEEGSDLHKGWEGILGTLKSLGLDKPCYLRTQDDIGWEDFVDQLQWVLGPMSFGAQRLLRLKATQDKDAQKRETLTLNVLPVP